MTEKSKEERLKETIRLLKKLKDVGVYGNDKILYMAVQAVMTQWVNDGKEKEEIYDAGTHTLILNLPSVSTKAATISLKYKKDT
jgi:hypothetical protein